MIGYVCSGCVGAGVWVCVHVGVAVGGWGVWVCGRVCSVIVTYNVHTPFMSLMHAVCPDIFGCAPFVYLQATSIIGHFKLVRSLNPTVGAGFKKLVSVMVAEQAWPYTGCRCNFTHLHTPYCMHLSLRPNPLA